MNPLLHTYQVRTPGLFKFKLTALAALCTSLYSYSGMAQESDTGAVERITVTASPIRDSQEESIMRQREAINVVNVIAADDIGRFPDQTAAAALARLPAVAVQRDQGQERYIQVRGAPSRWTSVSFDGINVLGAEERIFRFDSIPAAVMNSVEVSKTLMPNMSAEALAGQVNIQTLSPLAKPGFNMDLDLGIGRLELGDGDQERYAGQLSWGGEKVGVMLAASSFSMEQITDNNEMAYDANDAPTQFDFRNYQLTRETNAYMGKIEYAPDRNHRFSISSLYSEFLDHELRNQYILRLDRAISGTRGVSSGELVGVPVRGMLQDGNYKNSTFTNTLAGDHQLEEWKISWRLNYTETESSFYIPIIMQEQTDPLQRHSISYDSSNPQMPLVSLYSTVMNNGQYERGAVTNQLNQTGFGYDLLINYAGQSDTESYVYKLDFGRQWQMGDADADLKFGIQFDDREASSPGSSSAAIQIGALTAAGGIDWTPNSFVTNTQWDSDFNRGFNATYVDNPGLRKQLDNGLQQLSSLGLLNPDSLIGDETKYNITEEVLSAYVMNTWTLDKHQILAGVRVEQVDITSHGFLNDGDGIEAISVRNKTTRLYPAIHWNMDVTEDLKLRFAAVTGTSRPNFGQMRSGATVSDAGQSISGGNPDVKAETAYGFDGTIEWYFADAALLSVSAFYRDVDNVLFDAVTKVTDDRFNSGGLNRIGYDYTTTLNGSDGSLSGLEFSYIHQWDFLPDAFKGFGMQFNFALLDSEFTTPDGRKTAFAGTSDQVINAAVFYENYDWSIRLSWQWRDDWLDDISPDADGDYYWQESERLDLSVRYQLTDRISLYFDANNLTDEHGIRYQGNRSKPIEVEGFGRRYLFGIRANF